MNIRELSQLQIHTDRVELISIVVGAFLCACVLIVTPCMAQSREEKLALGQPLVKAVKEGDTATVRSLLHRGADPNTHEAKRTSPRVTPVPSDYISEKRRTDIQPPSVLMIALGLWAWDDPNYYEKHKVVPAIVQALVEAGANVNEADPDFGSTPLMQAAGYTDVATVECLIRHGAKINAGSRVGGNALWSIIRPDEKDRSDIMQALLRHGANPNARLTDGSSLLSIVRGPGRFKYVQLLLKAGAKVNARDKHGWTVITAIKKSKDSFFPGSEDIIPLLRKLGGHE